MMRFSQTFRSSIHLFGMLLLILLGLTACKSDNGGGSSATPDSVYVDTTPPAPVSPVDADAIALTEIARFISGMPAYDSLNDPFDSLRQGATWQQHRDFFDEVFANVEEKQLSKIRPWAETELDRVRETTTDVFYPFSGPDFLYGNLFFPQGKRYVMCGLEPVGDTPDLDGITERELTGSLKGLQTSLNDITRWSFFRTNDMKVDFRRTSFEGILPVAMVFMSRTGHTLLDLERVVIDSTGAIVVVNRDEKVAGFPGGRIRFIAEGQFEPRELYYFSGDIANHNWENVSQFGTFVRSLDNPVTYLKSASYLMHKEYFSEIRNLIFEVSEAILQDESGIAYEYVDTEKWNITYYGNYIGPIGLFSNHYQNDLQKVYAKNPDVKKLPFGIGYRYRENESIMLLMERNKAMKRPKGEATTKSKTVKSSK